MKAFSYKSTTLCANDIEITDLVKEYESPLYVYSQKTIEDNYLEFKNAFKSNSHLICYAVKANSNLAILNILASLGSGFDVVSIGELKRVLKAGGDSAKCVFSGVGKTKEEIIFALEQKIHCFNIESEQELKLIANIAKDMNLVAPISIRVNPNVDAKTHPAISTGLAKNKFGIDILKVVDLYKIANNDKYLDIQGVDCHIGSQITNKQPFLDALDKVLDLVSKLSKENIAIKHLDLGGGVGIDYQDNQTINIADYIADIEAKTKLKIILEPGRAIVGNAGIFVTKVEFIKQNTTKNFAIVDGAMNDLLRPSLYDAYHRVLPVKLKDSGINGNWDIVGPICETGDYFAKNRNLTLETDDLLAIMDAGAYGFTMASNYNTRPMVAEVLVLNSKSKLIRKRQTIEELFSLEDANCIK